MTNPTPDDVPRAAPMPSDKPSEWAVEEADRLPADRNGLIHCHPDDAAAALDAAFARGEQKGAREMREAAAGFGDDCVAAYPESVFPQPEPGQHGKTVDSCSAAMGRHLGAMFARQVRSLPLPGEGSPEEGGDGE